MVHYEPKNSEHSPFTKEEFLGMTRGEEVKKMINLFFETNEARLNDTTGANGEQYRNTLELCCAWIAQNEEGKLREELVEQLRSLIREA